MAKLFKPCHVDVDKYSGPTRDSYDQKFTLFLERCNQADILEENRHRALFIMLTGHARHYYSDCLKLQRYSKPDAITFPNP